MGCKGKVGVSSFGTGGTKGGEALGYRRRGGLILILWFLASKFPSCFGNCNE